MRFADGWHHRRETVRLQRRTDPGVPEETVRLSDIVRVV